MNQQIRTLPAVIVLYPKQISSNNIYGVSSITRRFQLHEGVTTSVTCDVRIRVNEMAADSVPRVSSRDVRPVKTKTRRIGRPERDPDPACTVAGGSQATMRTCVPEGTTGAAGQ